MKIKKGQGFDGYIESKTKTTYTAKLKSKICLQNWDYLGGEICMGNSGVVIDVEERCKTGEFWENGVENRHSGGEFGIWTL